MEPIELEEIEHSVPTTVTKASLAEYIPEFLRNETKGHENPVYLLAFTACATYRNKYGGPNVQNQDICTRIRESSYRPRCRDCGLDYEQEGVTMESVIHECDRRKITFDLKKE